MLCIRALPENIDPVRQLHKLMQIIQDQKKLLDFGQQPLEWLCEPALFTLRRAQQLIRPEIQPLRLIS